MRFGLVYDLRSDYEKLGFHGEAVAEFDSIDTIDAVESALCSLEHEVERIGNIWSLIEKLAAGKRWDMVFNMAEGLHGMAREAQVPALLDAYQIPYTFSSPDVMITCHNKSLAKTIVSHAGIKTAKWQIVECADDIKNINLPYPLFVKPIAEGTSKGISGRSLVNDKTQLKDICINLLRQFAQPVLIETYLPGREFTIGIIGEGENARAIGAAEVAMSSLSETAGRTYANKATFESADDYFLATDDVALKAIDYALKAWNVLGCRDGGRVDLRCDSKNIPHFLEINPLPGIKPGYSDLPLICEMVGITYKELIGGIVDSACSRLGIINRDLAHG